MNERLIDILLLTIIDAYEPANTSTSREERLAQAKQALLGTKRNVGNKFVNDDKAMLSMVRATLKDNAPTLAHEYRAARARLTGETFDGEPPPDPKLTSLRAMILAALQDENTPKSSKHSEEAAYKRLKRKIQNGTYKLGDLLEIEEVDDNVQPELKTIEEILTLLQKLGVPVGHNGPH